MHPRMGKVGKELLVALRCLMPLVSLVLVRRSGANSCVGRKIIRRILGFLFRHCTSHSLLDYVDYVDLYVCN